MPQAARALTLEQITSAIGAMLDSKIDSAMQALTIKIDDDLTAPNKEIATLRQATSTIQTIAKVFRSRM